MTKKKNSMCEFNVWLEVGILESLEIIDYGKSLDSNELAVKDAFIRYTGFSNPTFQFTIYADVMGIDEAGRSLPEDHVHLGQHALVLGLVDELQVGGVEVLTGQDVGFIDIEADARPAPSGVGERRVIADAEIALEPHHLYALGVVQAGVSSR